MTKLPRLFVWLAVGLWLFLLIGIAYPAQIGVAVFKVALLAVAGYLGYWLDRSLFPYARPDGYLAETKHKRYYNDPKEHAADFKVNEGYHQVFCSAMIRRAIIVGSAMLAIGLGA